MYTKGEWESFNHYVWTKDKQNIANCKNVQEGNPITAEESYANAQLISASPDLLEVCKKAYKHLREFKNTTNESILLAEEVMRVIDKAEGRF